MKISAPSLAPTDNLTYGRVNRGGGPNGQAIGQAIGPASLDRAVSLHTSDFLSELHASARSTPWGEVRADKVAEAKSDIAAGRLGNQDDLSATVDALLRGF
ncbi:MAG: hypothetical protein EXR71_08575 [Myxococcales bacterium]|nr:hypothetical protein [Myxococcales bacterium]